MLFHSINISKVIFKLFSLIWILGLCFWRVFVLLVGIFIIGVGKTYFCVGWFLLMICFGCWPLVAKRTCIKGEFHDIHALFHIVIHSVHARCLTKCFLGIFSIVWTPMSTKLWGFSCFLIRNIFGSLVVYLTHLTLHVHFSCIGHAHSHLLHTPLLPLSCIGLYLVSSS